MGRQGIARGRLPALALVGILALPASAADHYTVDPIHSIPVFEFVHLGITTQSGRFDKASGKITLDFPAHRGSVEFTVDTASLNMGFGTEASDSPGFALFEVDKFPTISFKSTKLIFDGDAVVGAEGQFTLHGVTLPLHLTVTRFHCAQNPLYKRQMCAGDVAGVVQRSKFGMMKYIPLISDEVKISVPVEAIHD